MMEGGQEERVKRLTSNTSRIAYEAILFWRTLATDKLICELSDSSKVIGRSYHRKLCPTYLKTFIFALVAKT